MIEISIYDREGKKARSLKTLEEIGQFFNSFAFTNPDPQKIIMGLVANHYRHEYYGIDYYLENINVDNVKGEIKVSYRPD